MWIGDVAWLGNEAELILSIGITDGEQAAIRYSLNHGYELILSVMDDATGYNCCHCNNIVRHGKNATDGIGLYLGHQSDGYITCRACAPHFARMWDARGWLTLTLLD